MEIRVSVSSFRYVQSDLTVEEHVTYQTEDSEGEEASA